MNKQQLRKAIKNCHELNKKVVVSFCSHVPHELFEAAGMVSVRLPIIEDFIDKYPSDLPDNLCPLVRACYSACTDEVLSDADLIIAESSCDGKKKMFELMDQKKLYYYQIPQGEDNEYSRKMIYSEFLHMSDMIKERFGITITEEALREACSTVNAERKSIIELMQIQKQIPAVARGIDIYRELEGNRNILDRKERTQANIKSLDKLISNPKTIPASAKRILVTGCPLGGIWDKVISIIENFGAVVVCFENCEVMKAAVRHTDTANPDILSALVDCYRNTACAIMTPNNRRFDLIRSLIDSYHADAVIDVTLQTCHPYTVETDKLRRKCESWDIPYMSIETNHSDSDNGMLSTRIEAFLEMLH